MAGWAGAGQGEQFLPASARRNRVVLSPSECSGR
jgi:hypothetical protein